MKIISLLVVIFLCLVFIGLIQSSSKDIGANHLEVLSNHWRNNKSSFNELVQLIESFEKAKVKSIVLNDIETLSVTSDPGYTIEDKTQRRVIQLMNKINVFRIRITPKTVTLSEFNTDIGKDIESMIRMTSSYTYYADSISEEVIDTDCRTLIFPPEKTTACDIVLNQNWVIAHSIIVPSRD